VGLAAGRRCRRVAAAPCHAGDDACQGKQQPSVPHICQTAGRVLRLQLRASPGCPDVRDPGSAVAWKVRTLFIDDIDGSAADQPPQSPGQWEQWRLHVTRKAIAASYLTHHGRPGPPPR